MMAANYFSRLLLSCAFSLRIFFSLHFIQSLGVKKVYVEGVITTTASDDEREIEKIENAITERMNLNTSL